MPEEALPDSPLRFTVEASRAVAAALAEVLPGDRYLVVAQPGMGHDGVQVSRIDVDVPDGGIEPNWYVDNTYGGDDGYSDHLRVYYTTAAVECLDDPDPVDAPRADADPVTIARWIVSVVDQGPPSATRSS